jgi:HEAT repeat protein
LGLTASSGLLPYFSVPIAVQASELSSQGSQDGLIKTCTGQRLDLRAPQLTDVDLKSLIPCASEVIPQLLEMLKSQDWKIQVIAAHTLGLLGKQAQPAIPALSNLIQDENADVRFVAAQALGEIGTEATVPALTKALQDKDENVRVSAAIAFQQIGTVARIAKPALIKALWDGNWYVRKGAATTISKLGLEESDIPDLLAPWKDGFQPSEGALVSLMVATNPHVRKQLPNISLFFIKALKNKNPKIRESAVIALRNISSSIPQKVFLVKNTNALLDIAHDKNPKVRQRVIQALGDVLGYLEIREYLSNNIASSKNIILALLKRSKDDDPDVRIEIAKYLSGIRKQIAARPYFTETELSQAISTTLIRFLYDEDIRVRSEVVSMLIDEYSGDIKTNYDLIITIYSKSHEKEIVDALKEGLKDPNLEMRIASALVLQGIHRLKTKRALLILLEGLRSENPSIRLNAIRGVNILCFTRSKCLDLKIALPVLIQASQDNDKAIKYAAVFILVRIQPKEMNFEKSLRDILRDILKKEATDTSLDETRTLNYFNDTSLDQNRALDYFNDHGDFSLENERGLLADKQYRYNFVDGCESNGRIPLLLTSGDGVLELFRGLNNENIRFISADTLAANFSDVLDAFTSSSLTTYENMNYYKNSSPQRKLKIDQLILLGRQDS